MSNDGYRKRCMGPFPACGHTLGTCTADPEYQAAIQAKQPPQHPKVTRLSEIKTNADRLWQRQIKDEFKGYREMVDHEQVHAYVVVAWTADGRELAFWNTEKLGPISQLRGSLAKSILDRRQNILDAAGAIIGEEE